MSDNTFFALLEQCIEEDIAKYGSVEKFRDSIRVDGPTHEDVLGKNYGTLLSRESVLDKEINKGNDI